MQQGTGRRVRKHGEDEDEDEADEREYEDECSDDIAVFTSRSGMGNGILLGR